MWFAILDDNKKTCRWRSFMLLSRLLKTFITIRQNYHFMLIFEVLVSLLPLVQSYPRNKTWSDMLSRCLGAWGVLHSNALANVTRPTDSIVKIYRRSTDVISDFACDWLTYYVLRCWRSFSLVENAVPVKTCITMGITIFKMLPLRWHVAVTEDVPPQMNILNTFIPWLYTNAVKSSLIPMFSVFSDIDVFL